MTKIILIAWLLIVHAFALLAILETDIAYRVDRKLGLGLIASREITPLYTEMVGSHEQLDGSVESGSIIFLGDSITQALNVAAITHPAINYGVGMDTSYGLIQRLPKYESLKRASHIVIAIGINDLIRTHRYDKVLVSNFQKIFDLLPKGIPVTVQAMLPVDERVTLKGFNQRIDLLNESLAVLTSSNGGNFINVQPELRDKQGNLKAQYHIGDGLHLNTEGYRIWINALRSLFSK